MLAPIRQTKEEIHQRRREIEEELFKLLEQTKSDFDLAEIKQIIYDEEDQDDLMEIVAMFDRGGEASELENILELVTQAWNYFPHKSLDGLLNRTEARSNSPE